MVMMMRMMRHRRKSKTVFLTWLSTFWTGRSRTGPPAASPQSRAWLSGWCLPRVNQYTLYTSSANPNKLLQSTNHKKNEKNTLSQTTKNANAQRAQEGKISKRTRTKAPVQQNLKTHAHYDPCVIKSLNATELRPLFGKISKRKRTTAPVWKNRQARAQRPPV